MALPFNFFVYNASDESASKRHSTSKAPQKKGPSPPKVATTSSPPKASRRCNGKSRRWTSTSCVRRVADRAVSMQYQCSINHRLLVGGGSNDAGDMVSFCYSLDAVTSVGLWMVKRCSGKHCGRRVTACESKLLWRKRGGCVTHIERGKRKPSSDRKNLLSTGVHFTLASFFGIGLVAARRRRAWVVLEATHRVLSQNNLSVSTRLIQPLAALAITVIWVVCVVG